MLRQLGTLFIPPIFPQEEDKTRKARYAHVIALAFLAIAIGFELFVRLFAGYADVAPFDLVLFGLALICLLCLFLLRKGYVRFTSFLLLSLVWLASNGVAATGFGARDASYIVNFAIVLMAGLLLGWQASLLITALSIFSGFALAYAEQKQLIGTTVYPITSFARDITFVFGLNGILIYLLIHGLENALQKSRMHLVALEAANLNLSTTQGELQNRSTELLSANEQLEERTRKLQAIILVTRSAASAKSLDLLLASITDTISKQLSYDHVHLFLLDEHKEFAILRSSSDTEVQKVMESGYRMPLKELGSARFVVQTGQPRVVWASGEEAGLFRNPGFGGSGSALILPLEYGEQVIGFLDIGSSKANPFPDEDVSLLTILADQVAITFQNLLLYEQSQRALHKADLSSMQYSAESWKKYEKAIQTRGYHYDGIKSEPLKDAKHSVSESHPLSVPVQLRGRTIGSFRLNPADPSRAWTDDELVLVQATAERVALALEGARLLAEAQKRANREAFLSNVATKLSASFQLDSILRDTVQELGQTLKNSTVTFQLVNPAEASNPDYRSVPGAGDE
jgi:GAF domain-containing protein